MSDPLGSDVRSVWNTEGSICDLDPYFTVVSGRLAVAHAVARRYIRFLRELMNDAIDRSQLPAIEASVRTEALQDERVKSAVAKATLDRGSVSDSLSITLSCETGDGPFSLVFAASALSVELLSIR